MREGPAHAGPSLTTEDAVRIRRLVGVPEGSVGWWVKPRLHRERFGVECHQEVLGVSAPASPVAGSESVQLAGSMDGSSS